MDNNSICSKFTLQNLIWPTFLFCKFFLYILKQVLYFIYVVDISQYMTFCSLNGIFFFNFIDWLIDWLIDLWLCWVFVSVRGLSLVAASGGHSSLRCAGLSLSRPLLLQSTGSRRAGSVIVAHRRSCSAACGIFPDQGSNPCRLHWGQRFSTTVPPGKPMT